MENRSHILIAEDDDINFKFIEFLIKRNSEIVPIRARNGIEAVHHAMIDYRINLILMDIKMPILDGLEATKRIKTIRPHLPIIAVSAFAESKNRNEMLQAGCDHFFTKPVAPEKLLKTISNYIKI